MDLSEEITQVNMLILVNSKATEGKSLMKVEKKNHRRNFNASKSKSEEQQTFNGWDKHGRHGAARQHNTKTIYAIACHLLEGW